MKLYTVRFTTRKSIRKFDAKGNVISETPMDTPVCLTALPYATAMSYSGADNFQLEDYVLESGRPARVQGVGNGTKKVDWDTKPEREKVVKAAKPKPTGLTAAQQAAITGNMTAAINA